MPVYSKIGISGSILEIKLKNGSLQNRAMFFFIFSTTIYFVLLCNMYVIIFSTSQAFLLGHHEIRQNIFTNAKYFLITWKSCYEPTYKPSFILDCICIWKINKECEIQKYFSHTLPYFFNIPTLCATDLRERSEEPRYESSFMLKITIEME